MDGEVVAETRCGWFGNNHVEVAEILELEFVRANKVNLNRKDNFFVSNNDRYDNNKVALYINLNLVDSIEVEALGELVASESDMEIYYGDFFNITATFAGVRETRKVMSRTYSRVVKKEKRVKVEALAKFLKEECRLDITSYEAEKVFNNFDKIKEFIEG